jgi:DNA-binding MarR family transcriptional regulator
LHREPRPRADLQTTTNRRARTARSARSGAATSAEVEAYEREYPGASWLKSRAARELEVVGTLVENAIADVARKYGLSHAAGNALAVIEGNGGPLPAGEISARMHITSGTMTTVLDTLERKGLIERLTDPDDRRRVLIEITAEAQRVLDRMLPEVQQVSAAIMSNLDNEQNEQLLASLAAVREALAALPQEFPPPKPRRTPKRLRQRHGQ